MTNINRQIDTTKIYSLKEAKKIMLNLLKDSSKKKCNQKTK